RQVRFECSSHGGPNIRREPSEVFGGFRGEDDGERHSGQIIAIFFDPSNTGWTVCPEPKLVHAGEMQATEERGLRAITAYFCAKGRPERFEHPPLRFVVW